MAGGRPTLYDPKFPKMLIEHMASGFSYESFAGLVEVSKQTIYDWEKVHEEFLDAKKIGSQQNLLYWEQQGNKGLWDEIEFDEKGKPISKRSLNSTVWIFNMKNRHRWRDRQDIELETKDSQLLERERLKKLSMTELLAEVKANLHLKAEE